MICALAERRHLAGERTATVDDPAAVLHAPVSRDATVAPVPRWRPSVRTLVGRATGWTVIVLGVILMPLPGPGTLIVVAGVRILVPHHRWAAASYDRIRERAVAAARAGVATGPRVAVSLAGVLWVVVLTGLYVVDASIPQVRALGVTVGPDLPFHSTATVVGLVVSCLATTAATGYSIVRLRPRREPVAAA